MLTEDDIMVTAPLPHEVVDPVDWFDSPGPVEIEIGCGKGGFLLERARSQPNLRLIGIEWANKYARVAADRMARHGLMNVRILRTDAGLFFHSNLVTGCLRGLHLYHPDPWPKRRHHKRRLVGPQFIEDAVRAIAPGAFWRIQTDHLEYFEVIRAQLSSHPRLRPIDPSELDDQSSEATTISTNFAVKYLRQGKTIYAAAYARV